VTNESGDIIVEPPAIAETLCKHWQGIFQETEIDEDLASSICLEAQGFLKSSVADVMPTAEDARSALKHSPNTGVGPDGIPYSAWRALGDFSVQLILLILAFMMSPTAEIPLWFNLAYMCFIPKDPTGHNAYGIPYYSADCTRPLSLADTFNKLLANTLRIALERFAAPRIFFVRRGFLKGRQVLDNVVELDHFAHLFSMASRKAAPILFDFRAAFPSVSHRFMWHVLEAAGLPLEITRLIRCFTRSADTSFASMANSFPGLVYGQVFVKNFLCQACYSPVSWNLFCALCVDRSALKPA
jgi:hypothetical protein